MNHHISTVMYFENRPLICRPHLRKVSIDYSSTQEPTYINAQRNGNCKLMWDVFLVFILTCA